MQQLGRGLEPLMLEQPAHQRLARIFLRILLRRIGPRQQHPRLDVDQRRRHHQELAGDVEVQLLHQVEVLEVLLRDERDRDVVDVDLVLLDEVQQQIERALEVLEADRVVLEDGLELELLGRSSIVCQYLSFTASRTRAIVSCATARARREPSTSDLAQVARPGQHRGAPLANRLEQPR